MSNQVGQHHKTTIYSVLLMIVAITVGIFYFGLIKPQQRYLNAREIKIDGIYLSKPQDISDFQLTDNHGNSFAKDSLKGHWTMMFFGFTNCGMVCPSTMAALNEMYKSLQKDLPEKKLPQVVLVSVDPDRDTIPRINDYVNSFNSHFLGARGDILKTQALEKQMHIVAAKMQVEGQDQDHYTINHTAEILVINPQGKLQAYMSYPHKPDQMVKDFKSIMEVS